MTGYDLVQVGSVQDEEEGARDGPLWSCELYLTNGRQLTVVGNLLHLAGNERRHRA